MGALVDMLFFRFLVAYFSHPIFKCVRDLFLLGWKYFRYPNSINWFLFISLTSPSIRSTSIYHSYCHVHNTPCVCVCVLCMGFGLGPIEFRPSIKIAKLFTTAFAQCVFFSPLYLINETNRFLAVVSIFSRLLVSFIFIRLFGLKSSKPHQCSAWNRNEDRQWA